MAILRMLKIGGYSVMEEATADVIAPATPVIMSPGEPGHGEINTLRFFVDVPTMRNHRTARKQKEVNTVDGNTIRRAITRSGHDYPWSQPICAIMSTGLGISEAFGNGQVPQ